MSEITLVLILVVALALLFDFSNGWHDAANAIATVVSTRVLSPTHAVLLAATLNVAGAFMSTAVAKMVGGGIVEPSAVNQGAVCAALVGALIWNLITLTLGLPTSSSHALLGGLVGAAFAQGGMAAVKFSGLTTVLEALFLSPFMGFLVGYFLLVAIYWMTFRITRSVGNTLFRRLQLVSSSLMAFSHGSNDAQKVMGIITLALVSGGLLDRVDVPTWVIVSCAVAMGLGTAIGGWRIIRTLGMGIVKMEPVHGFAAETSAAFILLGTAHFGLPVSTTHTIASSILGVGSVNRFSAVRWGVSVRIVYAWLFTLPFAALMAYAVNPLFQLLH
ncbi:MAG: inorganic phosphate transporter family protein [Nitrospirae bacterium]|nr:inorganic phosphate transporter family protein [Nitrospirota bacterium]